MRRSTFRAETSSGPARLLLQLTCSSVCNPYPSQCTGAQDHIKRASIRFYVPSQPTQPTRPHKADHVLQNNNHLSRNNPLPPHPYTTKPNTNMVVDMGPEDLPYLYDLNLVGAAALFSSAELLSLLPANSSATVGSCLTGIFYGSRSIPLISLPVLMRSSPDESADDEPEDSAVLTNVPFLLNPAFPFSYISYELYDDMHTFTGRKMHRQRRMHNMYSCDAQVGGRVVELNCASENQKLGGVNVLGADFCRHMKANVEFDYSARKCYVRPQVEE